MKTLTIGIIGSCLLAAGAASAAGMESSDEYFMCKGSKIFHT